jgi:hypothetical protein
MRSVRTLLGLSVVVCALGVLAAPTLAAKFPGGNFTASSTKKPFPLKIRGEDEAEVKLGPFKFEDCEGKAKGTIGAAATQTLTIVGSFKECDAVFPFGGEREDEVEGVKFKAEFLYKVNGSAELTGEGNGEVELGAGAVSIKLPSTGGCTFTWPRQALPVSSTTKPENEFSTAVYETNEIANSNTKFFPSGKQQTLTITDLFKSMKYSAAGGLCTNREGEEEKNGIFEGSFSLEVPNGNLGFERDEPAV